MCATWLRGRRVGWGISSCVRATSCLTCTAWRSGTFRRTMCCRCGCGWSANRRSGLRDLLDDAVRLLGHPEYDALRRAFAETVRQMAAGGRIAELQPDLVERLREPAIRGDIGAMRTILDRSVDEAVRRGFARGREQSFARSLCHRKYRGGKNRINVARNKIFCVIFHFKALSRVRIDNKQDISFDQSSCDAGSWGPRTAPDNIVAAGGAQVRRRDGGRPYGGAGGLERSGAPHGHVGVGHRLRHGRRTVGRRPKDHRSEVRRTVFRRRR